MFFLEWDMRIEKDFDNVAEENFLLKELIKDVKEYTMVY